MATELSAMPLYPSAPTTLEQAGLNADLMQQLVLKTLYFGGELTGTELSKRLGLGFSVFEPTLEFLKQQRLCEIAGGSVYGGASYRYRISDAGRSRTTLALEQNQYLGVAPVPLAQYQRYMLEFKKAVPFTASREQVRQALSHLVVTDAIVDAVGPAVNSGHSMFVYGSPGNGKTMIAQAIRKLLVSDIAIPHAIEVQGNIVKVFDRVNHEELPFEEESGGLMLHMEHDRRWVRCRRPLVMVGGELTMQDLDLRFNAVSGFYRAPVQMIANGGVLVIDDFGRQHCSPRDLLNRWIVPLDRRIDHLTLNYGLKFQIPFEVMVVFSTNLDPGELADAAFLRRIPNKISVGAVEPHTFDEIFQRLMAEKRLDYDADAAAHLRELCLARGERELRACFPRDICDVIASICEYEQRSLKISKAELDMAVDMYFPNFTPAAGI